MIERFFGQKNYDSIAIVSNRWEDFCGTTEPLFRLKVLTQIQGRTFSDIWMDKDYLMNFVFLYLDRLDYAKEPNAKQVYERYKIPFGYISLNSPFDDLTVVWANSLLEKADLLPVERAFCLLYSNQTDAFWQILKDQKVTDAKLQEVYNGQIRKTNKMVEGNIGILTGIFLPQSNLKEYIGVKPIFGFQLGAKFNKIQYDLTFAFRTGKPNHPYNVFFKDEIVETNYQFGGYIGLDVAYELSNNYKTEFDILGGIGGDIMDAIKGDPDVENDSKSLGSLNLNLGLGYRIYSKRMNFVGLQAKYNFVDFNNENGTSLKGNYMSLVLTYNFFGNINKHNSLKRMQLK
ncbi:MAG: hypothetical protein Q8T04_18320 [Bacteroidota bacterium]|nr:hypothetical protein [Bacteroidota bacterium]